MFEKILNKIGYYKNAESYVNTLPEAQICALLALKMDDASTYHLDKKSEKRLFGDLAAVEGFQDYLRMTCSRDIQRYFACENDIQRENVRGAFSRTVFLRGMLSKKSDDVVVDMAPLGNRYAK